MRQLWRQLTDALEDEWPVAGMAAVVIACGIYWLAPTVLEGVSQQWRSYWQQRAAVEALHEDERMAAAAPAKPPPSSSQPSQGLPGQTFPGELHVDLPAAPGQLNIEQLTPEELAPPKPAQNGRPGIQPACRGRRGVHL